MNITFNKTSKSNKIFSEWDVLIDGLQSQYNIIGEQHPKFKNIYSIWNNVTKQKKVIGSLENAKSYLRKEFC